ncbi:MAG: methyltransferase domain-containing protein [Desulfobacter sp.]|nr:MAG: methyltransferase domain-containing protein [Desulfobacter sp.]
MNCRFCNSALVHEFVDLNFAPASNSYLKADQLNHPETYYPLRLFVCTNCWLVQLDEYKPSGDIFNQDYAYFSSFSSSWLDHCKQFANMITDRLNLSAESQVIEIASNDGYLLQFFKKKHIPCLGIEPTHSTASAAKEKNIETIEEFFSIDLAKNLIKDRSKADLVIGNNVLAHVPDINDFVAGLKLILSPQGSITMEFPHLLNLMEFNQFDTIYHEHFSYLSLHTVTKIFKHHELDVYDVDQLNTHGGSLRIYAKHIENKKIQNSKQVTELINLEKNYGLSSLLPYQEFQARVDGIRDKFIEFLLLNRKQEKSIVGYGAAAKGNTLLNYCGAPKKFIDFVADASPHKQGKYLPGSHIPIVHPNRIEAAKPDYVILFPWNIKNELIHDLEYIREWNGRFVTIIPDLEVF